MHVAHTAYASWGARLGSALLDALIAAPGYGFGLILADATGSPVTVDPNTYAVRGGPDDRYLVVGVLITLLIWCLNLSRQGVTGSSLGQRVFGVRIVRRESGRPPGRGLALGHYAAHLLDLPWLLGFLWPLWDRESQTFADKLCGTIVLTIRQPGAHAR
ncbi:RDD family protein [Actinocrinis sp.]|uniref:RDD family protein n=1 Tax=Actinocrinis sp. TaxID=1920516 RepID=UPI0039C894D3